jgi:glycosyltransferase involved in cell wall biosynthesis
LKEKPNAVYCYEDCALETFRAASKIGCKKFLDYPVAHWRLVHRILQEENELQPAWSNTLTGLLDSQEKLNRKDEELGLSDQIIVASTFSKISLLEFPFRIAPVSVIPYGAPVSTPLSNDGLPPKDSKLRILFVGGLGQLKGIAYLIEALEIFGRPHALTIIGRRTTKDCIPLQKAIQKYRWIPSVSHDQLLDEMRHHDIFVFPSLSEGFGMVVTEALSQGLPVITTPHTCGPDVLSDEEDGFLVPIRNPQAIAEKLELLARDRNLLAEMSEAAQRKARKLSWVDYRRRIVEVVTGSTPASDL